MIQYLGTISEYTIQPALKYLKWLDEAARPVPYAGQIWTWGADYVAKPMANFVSNNRLITAGFVAGAVCLLWYKKAACGRPEQDQGRVPPGTPPPRKH